MNISIGEKKAEAVKRMKKLGIFGPTVKQFEKEDLLSQSEPPLGACYWVEDEQLERVKEFEAKHNALVYFVIHHWTNIGELENYLYVNDYKEEWAMDNRDIEAGEVLAYVYNHDMPECSEFGHIGVELTSAAGLRRAW